jgi:hypothetical protein
MPPRRGRRPRPRARADERPTVRHCRSQRRRGQLPGQGVRPKPKPHPAVQARTGSRRTLPGSGSRGRWRCQFGSRKLGHNGWRLDRAGRAVHLRPKRGKPGHCLSGRCRGARERRHCVRQPLASFAPNEHAAGNRSARREVVAGNPLDRTRTDHGLRNQADDRQVAGIRRHTLMKSRGRGLAAGPGSPVREGGICAQQDQS